MAIEVIKGTAKDVRYTIHVSGGENNSGVSTRHHTIFKLDGMTVIFTSSSPAMIGEGDRLVVAGRLKGRLLKADAYLNQTAEVRGDADMWASFALMAFCFLLGIAILGLVLLGPIIPGLPSFDGIWNVIMIIVGGFFCAIGSYCLYRWLHIRNAVNLIKSE